MTAVTTFFEGYARALMSFSPEEIAEFYAVPVTVFSDQGSRTVTKKEDIVAFWKEAVKPYAAQRKNGGKLILKAVTGKAEIWLDKKLVATKTTAEPADMVVPFPPSANEQKLNVLIETEKGQKAGLGGVVTVNALD